MARKKKLKYSRQVHYPHRVTIRLNMEQYETLQREALQKKQSMSQTVREWLNVLAEWTS